MKELKIGICGWGNVATGLFKSLNENAKIIKANSGANISVEVIGARRDNPKCNPDKIKVVRDIFEVSKHDIDVVVELIGGVDVASVAVRQAAGENGMLKFGARRALDAECLASCLQSSIAKAST